MKANEVSEILNISLRMVQVYCKQLNIQKQRNRYVITKNDLKRIKDRLNVIQTYESEVTNENETQDYRTEYYTETEYAEVQKRIIEYNLLNENIADLKNEVQYLRNSLDKQHEQMNVLLNSFNNTIASIRERNAIEYKNTTDKEL
jgi:predicted  nucleic acid-binding Zn-ribbon protein